MKTYFPIKIRLDKSGEILIIRHPDEIPSGESFVVLETQVSE